MPSKQPKTDTALSNPKATPSKDLVLVHGVTEDGGGYHVLRKRAETVEAGLMRAAEEGHPVHGELVRLEPRPESPLLFDAETTYVAPTAPVEGETAPAASAAGPARVATAPYRAGWNRIWGGGPTATRAKRLVN